MWQADVWLAHAICHWQPQKPPQRQEKEGLGLPTTMSILLTDVLQAAQSPGMFVSRFVDIFTTHFRNVTPLTSMHISSSISTHT